MDDESQLADFRGLLKEYLERSAESDGEFAVIPVASSQLSALARFVGR